MAPVSCLLWWIQDQHGVALEQIGVMRHDAMKNGEFWRLITATTLHADVAHLTSNITAGLLLLGLAMNRFGAGLGFTLALVGGIVGNLIGWLVRTGPYIGLGASGVVMAALRLLAGWAIAFHRVKRARMRQVFSAGIAGLFLFFMFGISPQSDIAAHIGGFVTGLISGLALGLFRPALLLRPHDRPMLLLMSWLALLGSWIWAAIASGRTL